MFAMLPALASVFGIAFLSLWASIPAGLALGLHPVAIVLVASLAYATGAAVVVLPGRHVRDWITRRAGDRAQLKPDSLPAKAWARYGLPGLALLAPITTGAQIGAIIGLALNAPPRRLLVWLAFGGFLWAGLLTAAISLGLLGVRGSF